MSFLVLVITDFVQKALINGLRLNHPASDKYKLKIYYSKGGGKAIAVDSAADADDTLELPEDMPIVEAYFKYADKHICSSGKFCRKMLGLDGDPVRSRAQTVVRHLSSCPVGERRCACTLCSRLRRSYSPLYSCAQWST